MTAVEGAKTYYPTLWPIERLKALVEAGRLSAEDYKAITGEEYGATQT